jgi:uncharacterized protein (DUF58 family)
VRRHGAHGPVRRRPRPERFVGPVAMSVFVLLAFAAVAHASGSGWVQAIGAVTAGLAAVGIIGPGLIASRLRVSCVECPRDGTSGEPLAIELVANRPLRCTPSRPRGEPTVVPVGDPVPVRLTPATRGVVPAVRVQLATAAPLGLLWWSVDRVVILPRTIEISPRIAHGNVFGTESTGDDEGQGRPVLASSGEVRGVRDYRHGDSRRRVHWRATAHTGSLMVRETETLPDNPVKVVAELSDDPETAEQQAGEVMGAVGNLLSAGKRVVLETVEHGERVSALVSDARHAGRRLAHAGLNPYADLPGASGATMTPAPPARGRLARRPL